MNSKIANSSTHRRVFMIQVAASCLGLGVLAHANAQTMLAETDPQAVALGYKADASKVDKTKQVKYAKGQACGNCALYQGAAGSTAGACPLFAAKQVSSKGWCSAYAKKG